MKVIFHGHETLTLSRFMNIFYKNSGWSDLFVSRFLQVGHLACERNELVIQGSQKTCPHVVDVN